MTSQNDTSQNPFAKIAGATDLKTDQKAELIKTKLLDGGPRALKQYHDFKEKMREEARNIQDVIEDRDEPLQREIKRLLQRAADFGSAETVASLLPGFSAFEGRLAKAAEELQDVAGKIMPLRDTFNLFAVVEGFSGIGVLQPEAAQSADTTVALDTTYSDALRVQAGLSSSVKEYTGEKSRLFTARIAQETQAANRKVVDSIFKGTGKDLEAPAKARFKKPERFKKIPVTPL